jgi:hypothetical protein
MNNALAELILSGDFYYNGEFMQFEHRKKLLAAGLLLGFNTFSVQASLVDRGNGMLYDNVLNITWLQDANYAKTSGYSSTGQMDWNTATTWAANLVYGGFSDWRLASNTPVAGGAVYNTVYSTNGTTDFGYNITSPNSELAYMYHVNLGVKDFISTTGTFQSNYGIFGNGTINGVNYNSYGQNNVGLVNNLQSFGYWSGAEVSPGSGNAWDFNTADGFQPNINKVNQLYAWAVRPGDVAVVPIPGAVWLFGSAFIGFMGFNRRKSIQHE